MRINLIRHSATVANELGMPCGTVIDYPLSQIGIKIIEDLVRQGIYPKEPGVLYASALSRTVQTLNIIYPGKKIHQTAMLNERSFGEVELYTKEQFEEYNKEYNYGLQGIEEVNIDIQPKGGESTRQVIARAKRDWPILVDEFFDKGYELVTICSHGSFIRDMAYVYGLSEIGQLRGDFFLDNGKGVALDVEKKGDELKMKIVGYIGGEKPQDVLIDYINRYKNKASDN